MRPARPGRRLVPRDGVAVEQLEPLPVGPVPSSGRRGTTRAACRAGRLRAPRPARPHGVLDEIEGWRCLTLRSTVVHVVLIRPHPLTDRSWLGNQSRTQPVEACPAPTGAPSRAGDAAGAPERAPSRKTTPTTPSTMTGGLCEGFASSARGTVRGHRARMVRPRGRRARAGSHLAPHIKNPSAEHNARLCPGR